MMEIHKAGMILILALPLFALALHCSGASGGKSGSGAPGGAKSGFALTSTAFAGGGTIPAKYGCGSEGNYKKPSIPLKWSQAPAGTKSFVLLMDDLHPVAQKWVHWLVINLPATAAELAEGASGKAMPAGAAELENTFGDAGYGGPCPPASTGKHTYRFRLYAMPDAAVTLNAKGKNGDAVAALLGNALGTAELQGVFP